ncbi:MAG: lysophospholipid transporter LplT [Methylibium sp.]|uniref:lysophospholipid transporter LplT n=1 Tax=Methylibium sp. TaxID=2067992 RepID=UPI0017CECEF9|nr:lysophospholipid transporter LplT [Methylibium sp.]MBA3597077.1 lysophospholipid transporter LplT [Methylibium sp.]
MKKGFYTIMSAQFFSSLADNALFVAAVELLRTSGQPEWQRAALVPMFALFYVVLAPFVGAFADAVPKGRVMFVANLVKVVGCMMMLFGSHPLISYAIVGLGAAAYSPAKYGILTELLPPSQLVKANGWIEGLTIGSIILGVVLGGQLVSLNLTERLTDFSLLAAATNLDSLGDVLLFAVLAVAAPLYQCAEFITSLTMPDASVIDVAIVALALLYVVAAVFNLYIPRTEAPLQPFAHSVPGLVRDFSRCNARLWGDKLGQISLATTTLFWGVSGNLRYIVLAWGAAALGYGTTQASSLVGVVAIGTAFGAILASVRMRLDQATSVIPLGIAMGVLIIAMNFIDNVWVAAPFLIVLGGLGGFLVVPMNALLQHRGHNLMGAGRSIAVQNFNEQACILGLGAFYTGMTRFGLSAFGAITIFGILVAGVMWLIQRWHRDNRVRYRAEVDHLLDIARRDPH